MSSQRPTRIGHLPSYSGDFAGEARSWQPKRGSRSGISLKGAVDIDEDSVKSPLTKLRVWLANANPLSAHGNPRKRRNNCFFLLVSCLCALYFLTGLRSKPVSNRPALVVKPESPASPAPPRQRFRTAAHTYRSDGLLEVNPNGTHPIFDLITKAEASWYGKLRKASATFSEALEEYVRRYHRPPPKGFDKWCVSELILVKIYIQSR